MRPQLIMACYGIFIIGTYLSCIASGFWIGDPEISVISKLAGLSVVEIETLGGWGIAKAPIEWFDAIITVVTWGYPYLDNAWGTVFKYVFLYPATVGVIVNIIQLAADIVQGLASTIRSLLPSS